MTPKMQKLLRFIEKYISEHDGVSPSYEDMMAYMGLKSKSGVNRLVTSLEERGLIEKLPYRGRAIRVTKPENNQKIIWEFIERKGLAGEFSDFLLARVVE